MKPAPPVTKIVMFGSFQTSQRDEEWPRPLESWAMEPVSVKKIGLGQQLSELVLFGEQRGFGRGPLDTDGRVIPGQAAFVGWGVVVGGLVEDFGGFGEHLEAMGEAFGDPELVFVFGGEVDAYPLAEGWGGTAQVYGYVEDFALDDADELALGVLDLVMETAEDAFRGAGVVVLNEGDGSADGVFEGPLVEAFEEEAARVAENIWIA